ncbi:MAG: type II toxin-antitoxin system HipA family toxin [Akkermansiaceae bacterium]
MKVEVFYLGGYSKITIGHLTETSSGRILFEYDREWQELGIELSPRHLPLSIRGAQSTPTPANGPLFGLFSDSLPDWWGEQMMLKFFEEKGIPWNRVSPLQKLSCTGEHAMGGLGYSSPLSNDGFREELTVEVAELVQSANSFVHGKTETMLPGLMRSGLAAGGAQPKAVLAFNKDFTRAVAGGGHAPLGFERWLLKFDLDSEYQNGREEHAYALMARACGIDMAQTHLLECEGGACHFLSKRFDRPGDERRHIHTYSGLTHTPISEGVEYGDLIKLTRKLTQSEAQVQEVFRRACFNVLTGNNDDHGKNHAFLMRLDGSWELTPAYDLTNSSNALASGMRAGAVGGKRVRVRMSDLLIMANSLNVPGAENVIEEVLDGVRGWSIWAEKAYLSDFRTDQISEEISTRCV